ncbi:hypothetical protein Mgra_00004373 [Meloidogyne graminicola]|uniref:G-protein coupled receptors family 1 profile domain-containing protein n=1 Tax=Meloidogyne graminicola TaxID=189291 RepID=A0A8S9ZRP6_9BILA|nr:hypothetical protein Mgra_00004373 [Meloidogyne graminicola]
MLIFGLNSTFIAAIFIYSLTLLIGLFGNCWVVASVMRTTKKGIGSIGNSHHSGLPSVSPSDRLRKYIWLLALIDLFVSSSLLIPNNYCQISFCIDNIFKLCSITCLACISIERFITIRKPFNNKGLKVRRLAVQLTPLCAFLSIGICGSSILWLSLYSVKATENGLNCTIKSSPLLGNWLATSILAIGFSIQLILIATNYVRIIHHVRRKFWQRKARAVANSFSYATSKSLGQSMSVDSRRIACGTAKLLTSNSSYSNGSSSTSCTTINNKKKRPLNALQQIASTQQNLFITTVPEPRYMKEMTTTIMRVAAFHLICWLPFCLIQLMPSQLLESVIPNFGFDTLKWRTTFSSRIFDSIEDNNNDNEKSSSIEQITSAWLAFGANWLSYANSAGNWVLYAALNRDLRSIIKACSERRQKRYTIPQQIQQQNSQAHHSSGGGSIRIKYSSQGKCSQNNCNSSSGRSRNGAFQVFRFFYSLNSHRSSASIEADGNSTATILPGNPNVCVCICGSNAQQHLLSNNNNNENKIITTKQPICCSPKNSNSLLFLHAGTSYSALALCCVECNCNCGGQSRKHSAQSAISNLFYGGGEKLQLQQHFHLPQH